MIKRIFCLTSILMMILCFNVSIASANSTGCTFNFLIDGEDWHSIHIEDGESIKIGSGNEITVEDENGYLYGYKSIDFSEPFKGWFYDPECTKAIKPETFISAKPDGSITIYGETVKKPTYNVTFYINGNKWINFSATEGDFISLYSDGTVDHMNMYGSMIDMYQGPTSGEFTGWFGDKSLTKLMDSGDWYKVKSDVVFYGKLEQKQDYINIYFHDEFNDIVVKKVDTGTVLGDAVFTPTHDGYTFVNWYVDENEGDDNVGCINPDFVIKADGFAHSSYEWHLYARWKENEAVEPPQEEEDNPPVVDPPEEDIPSEEPGEEDTPPVVNPPVDNTPVDTPPVVNPPVDEDNPSVEPPTDNDDEEVTEPGEEEEEEITEPDEEEEEVEEVVTYRPDDRSPVTGDNFNDKLIVFLIIASIICMSLCLIIDKKKKEEE